MKINKKLVGLCLVLLVAACSKTAFTGRKSMTLIPNSQLNQMSFAEYNSFLSQNKTLKSGAQVDLVKRVGNDIKLAAETYYQQKGMEKELKGYAWEFNVVESPEINAFCMPGGKVVVYTGILNVTKNEDALAVVMGHEVAHALANHGNERMSQGLIAQLGLTALDVALQSKPQETRAMLMSAAGAATQVGVLLPFSRKHESEADEIGLYLTAMAGYNPNEAAPFWQRMNQQGGGSRPPAFLSTHPDPKKRSEDLKALVPKARAYGIKYPAKGSSKYRR